MDTATKASTSQTASQARGVVWREAKNAAARAGMPMATPPQPGTAGNSPAHRNFHGSQPVTPRKVQQLRVEAEALDALLFKDDAARLAAKGFEAALRIHEGKAQT